MIKLRKGDVVTSPQVEKSYLTSNKEYEVKKAFSDNSFIILDDNGKKLYCVLLSDGHLDGLDWILKK